LHQYDAFKAESRDYDKLIWGTPSVGAAITGLALTAVFGQGLPSPPLIKASILAVAAIVNFALFHGLVKHRFFQEELNRLIDQLEKELQMIDEPKRTEEILCRNENRLKGFLYSKRAYYSLVSAQAVLFASLSAAIAYILSDSGLAALATFGGATFVLYCLVSDP